ncbi:hypothetical protein HN587_06975 [Candidatus Woesearchaeota archaeon]|jgi:2-(3-amino-3-carboxypropyl)histidine synthase|nr:hypothetical protein [Candidatus Woesearchaeota archaeon]
MKYELELNTAVEEIKQENAKLVCVQLPDGLKTQAKEITDFLQEKTKAKIIIWAGSCFGACDVPLELEKLGVDLIIQWGHNNWKRGILK